MVRLLRWGGVAVVLLAAALVAARLALPSYLRDYVNRTIDQSPDYDGRVGDIEVHLWRGAYTINDLKIVKSTNSVPVPFFEGRKVDFSLEWRSLLRGTARGKVVMDRPKLNFVHSPSPEETQTGADQPWLEILQQLYPFRIDSARIVNGEIHFHTFHTDPRINIYLSDVQAELRNLTNIQDKVDPQAATITASGTAMDSGQFDFEMTLNPTSYRPEFTLAVRLVDLDVRKLNALTRAYGQFDFESGQFDFVLEASAKDGFIDGYAKPLFRRLEVFGPRDITTKDPFHALWEALVGIVGAVFKNQSRDQFGTRITFEGDLNNPQTNILEVVGNVLRNAFVRAYLPQLERGAPADEDPSFRPHVDPDQADQGEPTHDSQPR